MSAPLRAGVWGVGVWGEKHARVYRAMSDAGLVEFVGVFDQDAPRAEATAAAHRTRAFTRAADLLGAIDAVSIAVPTVAHRAAAEQALGAGVHALVEKPMAPTVADADAMIAAAQRAGRTLQVGHVERFNPALIAARPMLRKPKFVEAHRLALFQPRSLDIDVVFDLMIHDIDVVLDLVGAPPETLSAVGVAVLSPNQDIANARLEFPDGCVANLTASRVSQDRLRRMRFFQDDGYLSVDLYEKKGEFLRVDGAVLAEALRALGRAPRPAVPAMSGLAALGQAMPVPGLPGIHRAALEAAEGEPLRLELEAFVRSLRGEGTGAASAWAGREALRVAEDVRDAMKRRAIQWATG